MSEPLAFDPTRPFTTAQGLAAGLTVGQLRGRRFARLHKGVYVDAGSPLTALARARAALLTHPDGAFVSHGTAARVLGLPVPEDAVDHVSVGTPNDRRRRTGVVCHITREGARVIDLHGVPVSSPLEVFTELSATLRLVDLVVVGDAIVGKGWATPDQLIAACLVSNDSANRRALRAARYVRTGVDSPMETRLRMLIVLAGLPEPTVNFVRRDHDGQVLRRYDLCYPDLRIIIEYDGRQHANDPRQWNTDIYRREELDDAGWRIVVVTAEGVYRKPEETLTRIRKVLADRRCPGLPRTISAAWRPHFPAPASA